ncbi:hypothetical protein ACR3K2_23190 [Cryptosporidium serpentis]
MVSDNSSFYSDSSLDNNSNEEDWIDDDFQIEFDMDTKRDVCGLTVDIDKEISYLTELRSKYGLNNNDNPSSNWLRLIVDRNIGIEISQIAKELLSNILCNKDVTFENLILPKNLKINDPLTKKDITLLIEADFTRGDEIILGNSLSESKFIANICIGHIYIYKENNSQEGFLSHYVNKEVDQIFGFKTWHKQFPLGLKRSMESKNS